MANRRAFWVGMSLSAVTAAVLVGAGAYAFGSSMASASEHKRVLATVGTSGESASPGPTQKPSATVPAPSSAPTSSAPASSAPMVTPSTTPSTTPSRPSSTDCPQDDRQRDVEASLAQIGAYGPVTVDGEQSPEDCAAIKEFQKRHGVSPAQGRAGPTTSDVARRIAVSRSAAEQAKCAAGGGVLTVCVDLTQQTAWAVRDGAVVWGPTIVRTGMRGGYQTPTGSYRIYGKNQREWSRPYKVWLPYWQAFNGEIGFHETTTYIHDGSIGSHGCVNLLHDDAVALWKLTSVGTTVQVFGNRPGT
jgi:lipoprotein-anchoring transpeptidase ErfK/SrfK